MSIWPFRRAVPRVAVQIADPVSPPNPLAPERELTDAIRAIQFSSPAPIPEVQPTTITKEITVALSFTSILSDIGNGLKKFFSAVVPIAESAEPIVAVAFPGISALYTATVTEVANAETAAIAAGAQSGSSTQKLAAVVAAITPTFTAYAAANGMPAPTTTTITTWTNAIVASLNAIPAATPTA